MQNQSSQVSKGHITLLEILKVKKVVTVRSFNSTEMLNFTSKRDIKQAKILPGHSSPNNTETVMNPLVKAMKIEHLLNKNEAET